MSRRTPLYDAHVAAGAQLVDFSGWEMPLHYGSQLEEHHAVRNKVGMFDVSHMGIIDISGPQAYALLRYVLANDVAKLTETGKGIYGTMLNEQGGVIDDLITYRLGDEQFRIVWNAGTREKNLAWLTRVNENFGAQLTPRDDLAMLAVQGPDARNIVVNIYPQFKEQVLNLKPFRAVIADDLMIARTGYTGEDGVEVLAPHAAIQELWRKLLAQHVQPCGLGARDTLRLEAGLNLYGHDMDENINPYEANLAWTVALKDESRDFMGRKALEHYQAQEQKRYLIGLVMTDKGVLRDHQQVLANGEVIGEITSGGFSPTLGHAIALARVTCDSCGDIQVDRRGKLLSVTAVKVPFVRNGKKVFELTDQTKACC